MEGILSGILTAAVTSGTVIAIAGMGEILAERTGIMNLGLEGIMMIGAVTAIIVVNGYQGDIFLGLFIAILMGLVLGIVFAVAVVFFQADQVLCGIAINFVGSGIAVWIGSSFAGQPAIQQLPKISLPILSSIPFIGKILFNQNMLVYAGLFILPAFVWFLLFRTKHGLKIRAVGENPAAADASGIPVYRIRCIYCCVCGMLAALAGAYITLGYTPAWTHGVTGGRGWIAIALVIFGGWQPWRVVLGSLLFGGITSLGYIIQVLGWGIPPAFLSMLPYLFAVILISVPYLFSKGKKILTASPDALGFPYYRE